MDSSEDAIIRTWALLTRVRRMAFTAEPGPGSRTGWRGRGSARLDIRPAGRDWRLVERGRFRSHGARRAITFSNVYRWQRSGDAIALSHERLGAQAAVFLFELVPDGPDRLVSRYDHRCGRDTYAAALDLRADGFRLAWRICGPAKDERLTYHYRIAPRGAAPNRCATT